MSRPHRKKRRLFSWILVFALIAALFVFPQSKPSQWLQGLAIRAVSPIVRLWRGSTGGVVAWYRHYFELVGVKRDNERLQGELLALQNENRALRESLAAAGQAPSTATAANPITGRRFRVIAFDPVANRQSLTIDAGSEEQVRVNDVVVANGSLLGRVYRVGPHHSQVLLLTDPDHAVGVTSQKTRAKGVLVGMKKRLELNREHWLTRAEYLRTGDEVVSGDLLVTSGLDGIFPQGIPVGQVSFVKKDAGGLFWYAEVEPLVEFPKLEWVQVLSGTHAEGEHG